MIVDGIEMYIRLESSRIDVAHTVQKHRCYSAGFMHLRLRLNEAQRGIFVLYVVIQCASCCGYVGLEQFSGGIDLMI